jgi:hypothetical protein
MTNPPAWAESVLRLFLTSEHRDSVSGDLLEEYRERVQAGGDRAAADRWYLREVGGFFWRATWAWGAVLALLALGRFALDVFVPPASFHVRSSVTTYSYVATFMAIGFHAVWRGRSFEDAVPAVLGAQIMAMLMIWAASLVILGIRHGPQTLTAIELGRGIGRGFALLLVLSGPAILFAGLGGAAALILPHRRTG